MTARVISGSLAHVCAELMTAPPGVTVADWIRPPTYKVNGKGRYSLEEAKAIAQGIFTRHGIIVAVTEHTRRNSGKQGG